MLWATSSIRATARSSPGVRTPMEKGWPMRAGFCERARRRAISAGQNTTIGVVATNARLTKAQATKVAQMAHDGLARAIYPAHTMGDGDAIFALATGAIDNSDVSRIGALAADAMAEAIVRAVQRGQEHSRISSSAGHSAITNESNNEKRIAEERTWRRSVTALR